MTAHRPRVCSALAVLWCPLAALAADAASEPAATEATPLPPVVVTQPRDPLAESDRRLSALVQALPDAGSSGPRHKGATERLLDYYRAHQDPNDLDESQKQQLQNIFQPQKDNARP